MARGSAGRPRIASPRADERRLRQGMPSYRMSQSAHRSLIPWCCHRPQQKELTEGAEVGNRSDLQPSAARQGPPRAGSRRHADRAMPRQARPRLFPIVSCDRRARCSPARSKRGHVILSICVTCRACGTECPVSDEMAGVPPTKSWQRLRWKSVPIFVPPPMKKNTRKCLVGTTRNDARIPREREWTPRRRGLGNTCNAFRVEYLTLSRPIVRGNKKHRNFSRSLEPDACASEHQYTAADAVGNNVRGWEYLEPPCSVARSTSGPQAEDGP